MALHDPGISISPTSRRQADDDLQRLAGVKGFCVFGIAVSGKQQQPGNRKGRRSEKLPGR
jgi:hypothetical protein